MINYYYLAMYAVTDNGNTIEDASFFIQSPQFMDRQQIKDLIREKENYTTENIMLSNLVEIGEEMFKELAENKDDLCFKIV
ncbi:hypothetical protein [Pinibacter aurantiacus]|uniref:Uncharacterized protein n=1 Tax=Pinibacter aurantiacus TaxID=2851599 RepID=A0A9E2W8A3_9BACT|nr:hypothetical protein [Pinibacter aurantiacus]MBV4358201.1 hypothetical protein [Pinibacter aurantiacus]